MTPLWQALTSPAGALPGGFQASEPSKWGPPGQGVHHDGLWRSVVSWPDPGADENGEWLHCYIEVEGRTRADVLERVEAYVRERQAGEKGLE